MDASYGALAEPGQTGALATGHTGEVASRVTAKPATSRVDDSALVRAAQQGDHAAFEELVRLYDRNVLRLAMNLLHSEDEARDV